jgi:hypothetical protein
LHEQFQAVADIDLCKERYAQNGIGADYVETLFR